MDTKKAILLIEDNPLLTGLYSAGLKKNGLEVYVVHDGMAGLKMIEEHMPDIVLLDLFMPGVSGMEVLERIRKNPKTKDLKVVVLTINDKEEVRRKAEELGISDYFIKQEMDLENIIKGVVSHLS